MKKIGLVGWRGMVGSVLMHRMQKKNNFNNVHTTFLSTSQTGQSSPKISKNQETIIQNALNIELLYSFDIIVTCQGSKYTQLVYPQLIKKQWKGYWIDSSSFLRMKKNSIIVLDPINQSLIEQGINAGIKTFVGGNCTVSLMLMALGGLFSKKLIKWVSIATYQAVSGQGANAIRELLTQMGLTYNTIKELLVNNKNNILDIDQEITNLFNNHKFSTSCFTAPIIINLLPWIGNNIVKNGQTQEEWKGQLETNKILDTSNKPIPINSTCIRTCSLRCHSQAFLLKLKKNIQLPEIEELIISHNKWVKIIPNNFEESLKLLTPAAVSGTLQIPIGRLHKASIGNKYLSGFTVGDQLLWGAAEPIRRIFTQLTKL